MVLDGALAVVTGASGGIGQATAIALARRGARLVLTGRNAAALEQLAAQVGGVITVADLATEAGVRAVADAAQVAGGADILVNNAGVGWYGDVAAMPSEDLDRLVDIDFRAPLRLTRLVLGPMVARHRGAVVFIDSVAGHVGVPREAVYAATKGGLAVFADSLRAELAGTGVRVALVSPGPVDTGFFEARGSGYRRSFPRAVSPERVADAVVRVIEEDRFDAFVPGWLRVAAVIHGAWPWAYRRLAARAGG